MFRPYFLFPSCSSGCANLWVCRLVHGGECSVCLHGSRWQSMHIVCVHPCRITEEDWLKTIVETSSLMFGHVAKILLSKSASFHTDRSVLAAAWDLSPAAAPLTVLKSYRLLCSKWSLCLVSMHIKVRIASQCWALAESPKGLVRPGMSLPLIQSCGNW